MECPLAARADEDAPRRVSLYGGIATRNDTTQLFLHGHFHPDGGQTGLSVDRGLADLGIGVRYDFRFLNLPIGVSGFTGPSWAGDPPVIATGSLRGGPSISGRMPG